MVCHKVGKGCNVHLSDTGSKKLMSNEWTQANVKNERYYEKLPARLF